MNELDQLMRLADITGILSKNKKHHASPPPVTDNLVTSDELLSAILAGYSRRSKRCEVKPDYSSSRGAFLPTAQYFLPFVFLSFVFSNSKATNFFR